MNDPLEGFRAKAIPEEGLQILAMLHGGEDLEENQKAIQLAAACRGFLDTDIGKYIGAQVDAAEENFLNIAKEKSLDHEEVREAHWDYLIAVQCMLWIGNMVVEGEEALMQYESVLEETALAADVAED